MPVSLCTAACRRFGAADSLTNPLDTAQGLEFGVHGLRQSQHDNCREPFIWRLWRSAAFWFLSLHVVIVIRNRAGYKENSGTHSTLAQTTGSR